MYAIMSTYRINRMNHSGKITYINCDNKCNKLRGWVSKYI